MIPDPVTAFAATGVGVAAAIMFLCAVFDMRFQKAVSAMNAERRREARRIGWRSRLTGAGLPAGNRLLWIVSLALLGVTLVAANVFHHGSAAALGFSGFFLVCIARMALMARGYATDRFVPPFS